ncbi:MAG: hypothetical protein WBR10_15625 [Candidatus Acidiferrum sp.]
MRQLILRASELTKNGRPWSGPSFSQAWLALRNYYNALIVPLRPRISLPSEHPESLWMIVFSELMVAKV